MTIHQIASELQEAALLENTEAGEYWEALVNLSRYAFAHSSDEFAEAIEKELKQTHAWVFEHYEIKEVTETRKALRMRSRHIQQGGLK